MATLALLASCTTATAGTPEGGRLYPLHTDIVATTFWVGEIFDRTASDGSQVISTYDSQWSQHYGGCDGVIVNGACATEARSAGNGYFPTAKTPKENPFYLDLPFDDLNDPTGFAQRGSVIPGRFTSSPLVREPCLTLKLREESTPTTHYPCRPPNT